MPRLKPKVKPAPKKKAAAKKPDKIAAVNARLDAIVARLNSHLGIDLEAPE